MCKPQWIFCLVGQKSEEIEQQLFILFDDLWSQIKWHFILRQKGFHGTGTLCCLKFGLNMFWSGSPYLARKASLDPCWLGDQLPSWNRVSSGPCEPRPFGIVVGKGSCIVHECGSQSLKLKACCKVPEGSPGGDIGGNDGQVKGSVKKCLVGRLGYQTWLSGLSWLTC